MALRLAPQTLERALNWQDLAGCRGKDPELFFPDPAPSAPIAAKQICAGCPVTAQCMDYAIEHDELGIWGGTTERQRKRIKNRYVRPMGRKALVLIGEV